MGHVTFSDDVSVHILQRKAHQPSVSGALQPSEIIPLRSETPEYHSPVFPSMHPPTTFAASSLLKPKKSPQCLSFTPPYQSHLPLSIPPCPATFPELNSPWLTPPSYASSIWGSFDLNKTRLSNETQIISIFKDVCFGHNDCIGYEILVSPSSLLLEDEMAMFKAFPVAEPSLPVLMIEVFSLSVALKVQAGDSDFVTVWDVLETIYQHRNYLGDKQFCGFSISTDGLCLRLHFGDD